MLNPISVWERAFEIVYLSLLNQTLRVIKLGGAITHRSTHSHGKTHRQLY